MASLLLRNPPAAKLGGEIRPGIQWTGHSELIRAHGDVGTDLGGGDVLMAQQGLNGSQVGAAFNEVGREGMTQGVAGDAFHYDTRKVWNYGAGLTPEERFQILGGGKDLRLVN